MNQLTSKICIVGDFAVGKTSTVERFVNQQFSEKYLTTIGVKIDTKEIVQGEHGISHKLVIWDVAGKDRFGAIEFAYLRGASGIVYVADGTRSQTLTSARNLQQQVNEFIGPHPFVLLVNKSDLTADWEFDEQHLQHLRDDIGNVFVTSARTGDAVDQALTALAGMIAERELAAGP